MYRARSYPYLNASTANGGGGGAKHRRRNDNAKPVESSQCATSDPLYDSSANAGRVLVMRIAEETLRWGDTRFVKYYELHPSLDAFLDRAVKAGDRTFYCIVEEQFNVGFFADIELELKNCVLALHPELAGRKADIEARLNDADVLALFESIDFDRVCARVLWAVRCALEALYGRPMHSDDVGLFRADRCDLFTGRVSKYSCHAYVSGWVFRSIGELDAVMKRHVYPLLDALLCNEPLVATALDRRVYHHHRNMRLPLHEKSPGMRNHLQPWLMGDRTSRDDREWMRYGMVNHCFDTATATVLPLLDDVRTAHLTFNDALLASNGLAASVRAACEQFLGVASLALVDALERSAVAALQKDMPLATCVRTLYYAAALSRWATPRPRYKAFIEEVPNAANDVRALAEALGMSCGDAANAHHYRATVNHWPPPLVLCAALATLRFVGFWSDAANAMLALRSESPCERPQAMSDAIVERAISVLHAYVLKQQQQQQQPDGSARGVRALAALIDTSTQRQRLVDEAVGQFARHLPDGFSF